MNRYRGASPKNYVTFNNETWRILGVFPTDDGTRNIENRIKLIRNKSIWTIYWNTDEVLSTSSYNNWTGATLQTRSNEIFLTGLTSEAQSMINNAKYYLGGSKTANVPKDVMYQYERKISGYYYRTNPVSWIGKIAVMYASDYGYAASDVCTSNLYAYSSSTCTSNNWLFNSANQWTLSQYTDNNSSVFYVSSYGDMGATGVRENPFNIRPTLYLKSNVKITGGDGTSTNPYTLGI